MFVAFVEQKFDGCDYSIACGETLWRLTATTYEDALRELKQEVVGEWDEEEGEHEKSYWDERVLGEVILFEIAREEEMPLDEWYSAALELEKEQKANAVDDKERAEFERLKTKYGKRGRRK